MFEMLEEKSAKSGLRSRLGFTIWVGFAVMAGLTGSLVLASKLFPAQARQIKKLVEPIFFPAAAKAQEQAPKPQQPLTERRPTVRVVSGYDPYLPPREVPKDIITDVPEVYVPPSQQMGDLPTANACPPGAACAFGNVPVAPPPPPPAAKPEAPKAVEPPKQIRRGGEVMSAKLVSQLKPGYPPLARQARVQGVVRFTAVIDIQGRIKNLQLVSGHPLLVEAARAAVAQWVYQPTLLNREPVEVLTQIDVNFTLTQ
jgi:protein TonB